MDGMRTYTRQPVRRPFGSLLQTVQTLVLTIVVFRPPASAADPDHPPLTLGGGGGSSEAP